MPFSEETISTAATRAGARCECTMSRCSHGVRCGRSIKNLAPVRTRHRTPVAAGGKEDLANCEVICGTCYANSGEVEE